MKSNTKIDKQLQKKTNSELVETILLAKKKKNWIEVARLLSSPRSQRKNINLREIDTIAKEGEKILIPGKVLSQGELNKKIEIIALNFSAKSQEKLEKNKNKFSTILEEIKNNPDMKGLRILR